MVFIEQLLWAGARLRAGHATWVNDNAIPVTRGGKVTQSFTVQLEVLACAAIKPPKNYSGLQPINFTTSLIQREFYYQFTQQIKLIFARFTEAGKHCEIPTCVLSTLDLFLVILWSLSSDQKYLVPSSSFIESTGTMIDLQAKHLSSLRHCFDKEKSIFVLPFSR